jgi:hypothetical protein
MPADRTDVTTLRDGIQRRLVEFFTEPLAHYERRGWNDLAALKRHVRKGDVLLVEGDQRVSSIIKYLTQSSWSHAALYVGDEVLQRGGALAEEARRAFGDDARHLLVEALFEGVALSPLAKYVDYNIRLTRPHRLRPEHLKSILDGALGAVGWEYDLRNVLDQLRHLLLAPLFPQRLRRNGLRFGSTERTKVICSSLIGELFAHVRFPVLPTVTYPADAAEAAPRALGRLGRLLGRPLRSRSLARFRQRDPTLLTPRDFDVSPYFEIVKFNVIADGDFEYGEITWDEDAAIQRDRSS